VATISDVETVNLVLENAQNLERRSMDQPIRLRAGRHCGMVAFFNHGGARNENFAFAIRTNDPRAGPG
jgi:hypothetical protein